MPPWAITFLIFTAAVSLFWSHNFPIGGDEFLELWGDQAASISRLVHIQRALPTEIDPFFYHALTFFEIHLFGVNPLVLRLPSLLGFLLMQVSLFYYVLRIASERAAVFALAFPAITGAFGFTGLGFAGLIRPYGLLLGLYGLAMFSWQTAVRRERHRSWLSPFSL